MREESEDLRDGRPRDYLVRKYAIRHFVIRGHGTVQIKRAILGKNSTN